MLNKDKKILFDSMFRDSSWKNVSSTILFSLSYSNFHEDNEGLINRQINMELYASYVYTAMSHHFDRWDVALKGNIFTIEILTERLSFCTL